MQQRLGSDVEVEQSRRTAQLGQSEPSPNETGLVGQEQGDRVPLLQRGCSLQGSGRPAALFVHFPIRIISTFELDEGFTRMPPRCIQEAVQEAVEGFDLLVLDEPDSQFNAPQDVRAVLG